MSQRVKLEDAKRTALNMGATLVIGGREVFNAAGIQAKTRAPSLPAPAPEPSEPQKPEIDTEDSALADAISRLADVLAREPQMASPSKAHKPVGYSFKIVYDVRNPDRIETIIATPLADKE